MTRETLEKAVELDKDIIAFEDLIKRLGMHQMRQVHFDVKNTDFESVGTCGTAVAIIHIAAIKALEECLIALKEDLEAL